MSIEPRVLFDIAWTAIRQQVIHQKEWLPQSDEDWLKNLHGVFVTAYTNALGKKQLRGCIGLPYPTEPLGRAIAISARRTVSEDPRFHPVKPEELGNLSISLEILSEISEIEYERLVELESQINLGTDGLIIKYKNSAGLLLPRVPTEYGWTKAEFLQAITRKAFLPYDIIEDPECKFYKFTSQFFSE